MTKQIIKNKDITDQDVTTQTIKTYDSYATDYSKRWFNFELSEQLNQFCSRLKPNSLILDLGTGFGRDVVALQKQGYRVIGLDRSAGMLQEAAKRGIGPLIQADMRHLPFARHSFDGVWASASLLHLPKIDLLPTLKDIYNILAHGYIYMAVKIGNSEIWHNTPEHGKRFFAHYHPAEIELALERANFHVLWFKLTADSIRPQGWINAIGWTKLNTVPAAANSLIFNKQGQVLLTRRADNGYWCIPGGHLDPGETIQQAAIREALEETGLHIEIECLTGMYNVTYPADIMAEKKARTIFIVAFRCKIISGSLTLNDEVTEFAWFDPQNLPPDLIMHHQERILDAV